MSVSRNVIANALEIPEECVRCDNCAGADRWINEAYICKAWGKLIRRMEKCLLSGDYDSYLRLQRHYSRLKRGKEGRNAGKRKKAGGMRRRALD